VSKRIISGRPWTSYEEFRLAAKQKGSGINARAVRALNSIGALTLGDNPRDDASIKANLYDVLNLPEFNIELPEHFYSLIDENEDYDETQAHILMGISKKIVRGKGWSRVEFLDKTGSIGIFDDQNASVEQGKTYLVLAGSNRIVSAVDVETVKDVPDNPLVKFLNYKAMPLEKDESYVLAFKPRMTKAGKKMATMIIADYDRNLTSVVVFPSMFAQGYMRCEPGKKAKIVTNMLKDGTIALQSIGR
jgi:hypothetical protein